MLLNPQEFEKKEHKLKARAATNLAFLHSLEGDTANAERYADLAAGTDKYSAQTLVNKVSQYQSEPATCCVSVCLPLFVFLSECLPAWWSVSPVCACQSWPDYLSICLSVCLNV